MLHTLNLRRRKSIKYKEEGFTLVELLIAILIIGVIVALALPIYSNQQKAAHTAALTSDVRNNLIEVQTWLALKKPVLTNQQTISVVKTSPNGSVINFPGSSPLYTTGTTGPNGINLVMSKSTNFTAAVVSLETFGAGVPGSSAGPYKINVSGQIFSTSELVGLLTDSDGTRPYYS